MHTTTYITFRKVILNQKARGTLNVDSTLEKLDIFLIAERITDEEYKELMALVTE